jgi:CRP-like cAMP-binding protein
MAKKQDSDRIRELRDAATRELEKGHIEKALGHYQSLERMDPTDPGWAKRTADCCLRLRRPEEQVLALSRAAEGYARAGFLLKAVALCKVILSVDPKHTSTQRRLAELEAIPRGGGPSPAPNPPAVRSNPPGAPLEAAALTQRVPAVGAKAQPGVFALELGDTDRPVANQPSASTATRWSERVRQTAQRLLPHTPLFSEVSAGTFPELVGRLRLARVAPGDVLFRAGDPADVMYVIVEGVMEVRAEDGAPVAMLGEGEFFGELGILAEGFRTRTVVGVEPTELLTLDRETVGDLVQSEPGFAQTLLRFVRERLVHRLTETSPLFAPFSPDERRALVSRFRFLEAEPDAVLIERGTPAEGLFVLLSGQAVVIREQELLAKLRSGDVFGEMSLLSQGPTMATVRAIGKAFLLLLPTSSFLETAMSDPRILMVTSELSERRRSENLGRGTDQELEVDAHLELV